MRFLKETIAIIFIIVFILGVEVITDKITEDSISDIDHQVVQLEKNLKDKSHYHKETFLGNIEKLENEWKDKEDRLSYFTEHDELEKVSNCIVILKSKIENDELSDAAEAIAEVKFRIEHIKNKQRLKLNNIF